MYCSRVKLDRQCATYDKTKPNSNIWAQDGFDDSRIELSHDCGRLCFSQLPQKEQLLLSFFQDNIYVGLPHKITGDDGPQKLE